MKILLLEPILPPTAVWGSFRRTQGFLPPMGLVSIYTYLKDKGYDVTFTDTQFGDIDEKELSKKLYYERYDIIGIPVYTPTADYSFHTAKICKSVLPDVKIIFGNIHASAMPVQTMQECTECDFIIRHEGEFTIAELIEAIKNKGDFSKILGLVWRDGNQVIVNPQRPFIENLDILPISLYSNLDLSRYVPHPTQYVILPNYPFITQRGCPYSCTFCGASTVLGKKTRAYSPARVIEELKILKCEKTRGVYFQDSTFTINRDYTIDLMEKMIKAKLGLLWSCNTRADRVDPILLAKMKAAGCRQIVFGVESANQSSLDVLKKGVTVGKQTQGVKWAQEIGIKVINCFILGIPGETQEMAYNTIRYAKKLAAQISLFYLPVPYPNTALYDFCNETGGLREDVRWSDYLAFDFDNPVYVNPLIGKYRMQYLYRRAFLEYYTSPRVWWQNLRIIKLEEDIMRIFRGMKALIGFVFHNFPIANKE